MPVAGSRTKDPNFRLRILLILLVGITCFGAILYWRTELFASQEYIEFPTRKVTKAKDKKSQPANQAPRVRKDLQGYEDLY